MGKIVFRYSQYADLLFHVLAHMQVNNASNLYSETYIHKYMEKRKTSAAIGDLQSALAELSGYYNEHFERLGIVNFLPLSQLVTDLAALKNCLLSHEGITKEDIHYFLKPFVSILEVALIFPLV